jgi:hypothetical protein
MFIISHYQSVIAGVSATGILADAFFQSLPSGFFNRVLDTSNNLKLKNVA